MIHLLTRLSKLLVMLATSFGIALTIFVALSAIMRYAIGQPFSFTEELVGLLFAALVFLTLPYVTVHRRHICITLITDLLPLHLRLASNVAGDILVVLYSLWFGWYAYDFARFSYDLGARSDMAAISLWPWMSLMALASVLMGVTTCVLIGGRKASTGGCGPQGEY